MSVVLSIALVTSLSVPIIAFADEGTGDSEGGVNANVLEVGEGKTYTSMKDAISAANALTGNVTVKVSGKVEYTAETPDLTGAYDSISFVGMTDDAEISITRNGPNGYISGSNQGNDCAVNFTDLILSKPTGAYANDAGFMNVYFTVYRVGDVTYTNCTFPDGACSQGTKTTYVECEFANQTSGEYSLWVYADTDVTVEGGSFTGVRGAKMYGEDAAKTGNLTLSGVEFTASVTEKPAIVLTYGESVTLEDTIWNNVYKKTNVATTFELDLDGDPNGMSVTSDADVITCYNDQGACGVLVNNAIYTTVAKAAEVAKSGDTVTLLHKSTETVELAAGVILNKNNYDAENVSVKDPDLTISSADDLKSFRDSVNAGTVYSGKLVVLSGNIDLNNEDWTPIGLDGDSMGFAGTFDGKGYVISNLKVDTSSGGDNAAGLFGSVRGTLKNFTVKNATVKNLVTEDPTVDGTAVIAGCTGYGATIDNVHVENATVESNRYVGGISGYAAGTFTNCSVKDLTVTATPNEVSEGKYDNGDKVGGIIGYVNSSATTISGNELKGSISINGYRDMAGIVGMVNEQTVVSDNTNNAVLTITVDTTNMEELNDYNVGEFTGRGTASSESADNSRSESATYVESSIAYVESYEEFNAAMNNAKVSTIVLKNNIFLSEKYYITRAVTIDGQGQYSFVANNSSWRTDNYKHLIGVNADNIILKDITLDSNNQAQGVNVYVAQNAVFDNVSIINNKGWNAALTVNGSTLTVLNELTVESSFTAIDVSNGTNVTTELGLVVDGVLDLGGKSILLSSAALPNSNFDKATNTDGTPYYVAAKLDANENVTGYQTALSAVTSGTVKLLADTTVSKNLTLVASGNAATLDLNGKTLTVADGYAVSSSGQLTVAANGGSIVGAVQPNVNATIKDVSPTVIADASINITVPEGAVQASNADGSTVTTVFLAQVGDTYYNNFSEAVADAKTSGQTMKLLVGVTLSQRLVVAEDETLSLDLNGNTLKASIGESSNESEFWFVENAGTLTIADSVGIGKITYKGNGFNNNTYSTIANSGTLVINGGTIHNENNAADLDDHAIKNSGTLVINGGSATAAKSIAVATDSAVIVAEGVDVPTGLVAKVGESSYYGSLQDAINDALAGEAVAITLIEDIETFETIVIGAEQSVSIDFNGKTVTAVSEDFNPVFRVFGKLNVGDSSEAGSGGIESVESGDAYCFIVGGVDDAGELVIEGGKYYGACSVVQVTKGSANITGGSFDVEPAGNTGDKRFLLNCIDSAYASGEATISVTGGTFPEDFDPSSNAAEGEGTTFLPEGYEAVAGDDGSFTVQSVSSSGGAGGMIGMMIDAATVKFAGAAEDGGYSAIYDAEAQTPAFAVEMSGVTLIEGTDYTVAWASNVEVGTATATITGTGLYTGTKAVAFEIAHLATVSSFKDFSAAEWYLKEGEGSFEEQKTLFMDYALATGLMSGYADPKTGELTGYFGPYDFITRGQVATILYRAACNEDAGLEVKYGSTTVVTDYADTVTFKDMRAGMFYTAAINWAKDAGVMTGDDSTGRTTVRPNDPVSREELALMLARYANGGTAPETELDASAAADIEGIGAVSPWAEDGMFWAINNGVIGGIDNHDGTYTLDPQGSTWRCAAAKMISVTLRDIM